MYVALTLGATGLLLLGDYRGSRLAVWLWKPLASTGFLAAALAAGALDFTYGRIVLAALCLCWLGDVLLIPAGERFLRAGVLAFLLGHVAFVAAFWFRGVRLGPCALALPFVAGPAVLTLRSLRPHLSAMFRTLVTIYVSVISLMVVTAVGTFAFAPRWTILGGALAFAVSDQSVARDRFVAPGFVNRAWGLPLYYVAQLLFAASVASP